LTDGGARSSGRGAGAAAAAAARCSGAAAGRSDAGRCASAGASSTSGCSGSGSAGGGGGKVQYLLPSKLLHTPAFDADCDDVWIRGMQRQEHAQLRAVMELRRAIIERDRSSAEAGGGAGRSGAGGKSGAGRKHGP
jgi:hypothetical protein